MTLTTDKRLIIFDADGTTTVFPFDFRVDDAAHLVVQTISPGGTITTIDPANYTVTGIGVAEGGEVTYAPGGQPLTDGRLAILREVPFVQDLSITNQDGFFPQLLERQLDQVVMQTQQLAEEVGRSVVVPVGSDVLDIQTLIGGILELAPITSEIETVAGISGDVTATVGNAADISAVAANIGNIQDVKDALDGSVASGISYDDSVTDFGLDPADLNVQKAIESAVLNPRIDVASAATTDIGAAASQYVRITGTTTITGLGTASAGVVRDVLFGGALTLTHNATSLILPGADNIATVAGDTAMFRSEGSGNWRCVKYTPFGVTPETVVNGTAKAWINFDGTGTNNRASFNVSSRTNNGTGDYTVNLTNAFASASVAGAVTWASTIATTGVMVMHVGNISATAPRIYAYSSGALTFTNVSMITSAYFGDLA